MVAFRGFIRCVKLDLLYLEDFLRNYRKIKGYFLNTQVRNVAKCAMCFKMTDLVFPYTLSNFAPSDDLYNSL